MKKTLFLTFLIKRLVDKARAYGRKVNTEKSKIVINSTNCFSADTIMNGQKLKR